MTGSPKYAIFIEPEGALRDLVIDWKTRIVARWPRAAYVTHPPHATIWIGALQQGESALAAVGDIASGLTLRPIAMRGPAVFADDVLAGRGQTCTFGALLDEDLAAMQQVLCDAVLPSRVQVGDEAIAAALQTEPFLSSWRTYGFPFVGAHWLPHFTVASLPVPRDHAAVTEFQTAAMPPRLDIYRLSWWRVTGDTHERLAWLT